MKVSTIQNDHILADLAHFRPKKKKFSQIFSLTPTNENKKNLCVYIRCKFYADADEIHNKINFTFMIYYFQSS